VHWREKKPQRDAKQRKPFSQARVRKPDSILNGEAYENSPKREDEHGHKKESCEQARWRRTWQRTSLIT